jgi:hypothetical protein
MHHVLIIQLRGAYIFMGLAASQAVGHSVVFMIFNNYQQVDTLSLPPIRRSTILSLFATSNCAGYLGRISGRRASLAAASGHSAVAVNVCTVH